MLATPVHAETIHTTANHPWLTADRGWVAAGDLHAGEGIVTLDGAAATVAWVRTVPGQADRYNLTVASDHTYAVGASRSVVHNCGVTGNEKGVPGDPANKVPGQQNLYYGQAADTDALSQEGWGMTRQELPSFNTSQPFANFIRSKYPNESVVDWTYHIETWTSPNGETLENHYWSNSFTHPGEYYHHH